jgi:hypothetical protein
MSSMFLTHKMHTTHTHTHTHTHTRTGSLSGGAVVDRVGRWWGIVITAIIFIVGSLAGAGATTYSAYA